MRVRELGRFIRDQRGASRLSLRKLSSLAGISNPYLSQIERGLRRPSAEILQAIAKALRISAETLYVKAGILEERPADADISSAIRRDGSLTQQQRKILLELYQSFRQGSQPSPRKAQVRKVAAARKPKSQSRTARATKRPASAGKSAGRSSSAPRKSKPRAKPRSKRSA